jgi:hypothetical protein
MLSEILERISIEANSGEQERRIIYSFLQKGEPIDFIRDICLDSSLRLSPEIVDKILENHVSLAKDDNFIYVPSINLYVAKERSHLGKGWFKCHKLLQADGERMMIPPEFIEFLKYCKTHNPEIYEDITAIRSPWRAEWLDASFEKKGKDLFINYNHVLGSNGNLIPKNSGPLDKETLMEYKRSSLDDYLNNNHTTQGLPNKKVQSGDLYYYYPVSDNNSVAKFVASSIRVALGYDSVPSDQYSNLGVRAVRHT